MIERLADGNLSYTSPLKILFESRQKNKGHPLSQGPSTWIQGWKHIVLSSHFFSLGSNAYNPLRMIIPKHAIAPSTCHLFFFVNSYWRCQAKKTHEYSCGEIRCGNDRGYGFVKTLDHVTSKCVFNITCILAFRYVCKIKEILYIISEHRSVGSAEAGRGARYALQYQFFFLLFF